MIYWKCNYSLNDFRIDSQHKELFRLVNEIESLSPCERNKATLSKIIKQLFNYMKEHFSDEEEIMKNESYPYYHGHKRQHEEIIEDMTNVIKESKTITELHEKVRVKSYKWLVDHILEEDMNFKKWRENE